MKNGKILLGGVYYVEISVCDARTLTTNGSKKYTHQLPSIRNLMKELNVSQATVSQALHQLVDLNRIYVKENVGYFVLPNKKIS
ncbi:hypothetical protein H318_14583 [Enterococcus durans IPLA 655]|nr:hypothetical protein H318_14583 [Enterococcus durans IPLA 655]